MTVINIIHISKYYYANILHERRYGKTLKKKLSDLLSNPMKLVQTEDQDKKIWALQDITFSAAKGEMVGIIGANGAGKTTLLKIIAGITPPTKGEIHLRGNIASLLRIDVGFHPDLTGRENIFLRGIIFGLTKKEIALDFHNIVAFSGIKKFIDMPVKYYSSGMRLRLAFSVTTCAYAKPDILLIDEAFAVGDADFYIKSLERIRTLIKEHGSSVLFASHNLKAIEAFCTKCVWIDNGRIKMTGVPARVIKSYLKKA